MGFCGARSLLLFEVLDLVGLDGHVALLPGIFGKPGLAAQVAEKQLGGRELVPDLGEKGGTGPGRISENHPVNARAQFADQVRAVFIEPAVQAR